MGKGHQPLPAPQNFSSNPTSSGPAPTYALPPSFTTASLPAEPTLPPTAGGPGFRKRNAEFDFPARDGCAAETRGGPAPVLLAGAAGHQGCRGTRSARKGAASPTGTRAPWSALCAPAGPPSAGPPSPPPPGQASELTDAGLSGPYSPGPPYFPALNLGRPGALGTSPGPWRVPGARADAGAFLSAGPSYMRRAGPPGEQRGPSPRRAGPGGPRGGTGRPYSPGAPSPRDRLLRPSRQLPAVWTSQVFPGSELQEALC